MEEEKKKSRKKIIFLVGIIFLVVFILSVVIFLLLKANYYNNYVLKSIYVDKYNISDVKFNDLNDKIDQISAEILKKNISFNVSSNTFSASYEELGIALDKDSLIKEIKDYQKGLGINKLEYFLGNKKYVFKYRLVVDEEKLRIKLQEFKNKYDFSGSDWRFEVDDNRNVKFVAAQNGIFLNIDKSVEVIKTECKKGNLKNSITLKYDVLEKANRDSYKYIDTKVSEFTTLFNPYISRATNLKMALSHIDGVVIEPGEVFSFYKYAGPYNRKGYVFYYEYVGNGVCQIATTIYNTALLGGLEIVRRYPHAALPVYVPGGLDATVASYANGGYVDFQFKNTYKYPIYISAYAKSGEAHVDFWSNSMAKEGKTYTTESVKIGYLGYNTYLHVFENGQEIEKRKIATTWYSKSS